MIGLAYLLTVTQSLNAIITPRCVHFRVWIFWMLFKGPVSDFHLRADPFDPHADPHGDRTIWKQWSGQGYIGTGTIANSAGKRPKAPDEEREADL